MLRGGIGLLVVTAVLGVSGVASDGQAQTVDIATSGSTWWDCDIVQNCAVKRATPAFTRSDWRVAAYLSAFGGFANPDLASRLLDRMWGGYRPDYLDGVTVHTPDIPTPVTPDIPTPHRPDLPPPPPVLPAPGATVTPEPATLIMLATGLGGVGLSALRRRRKSGRSNADVI